MCTETSPNSGNAAQLYPAKIQLRRTSYVHRMQAAIKREVVV